MLAAVSVSGAINSSLGKVIISKRACLSEVVVRAACTLTTSSLLVSGGKVMLKGFLSIFGMRDALFHMLGRVDQFGMIAALASLRPRVQIPPRPPQHHDY